MNKINEYIEDLLHNHNCVIIPDFGGFITSEKEAFYDKKKETFFPASSSVLFNKNLVFNDGLLASRIAEKQSVSFEKANNQLLEFKNNCNSSLNNNGRCEIEKVGVLFFDKEKNIQFQQSQKNYLLSSYGLNPKLKQKTNPMIKKETIIKEKTTTTVVERKETQRVDRVTVAQSLPANEAILIEGRKRNAFKVVPLLVIPMLLITAFFGNQKGIVGDAPINMASLNPFSSTSTEVYTPRNGETFLVDEEGNPISVSTENTENFTIESENLASETEETEDIISEEEEITTTEVNEIETTPEVIEETTPKVAPQPIIEEVIAEPIVEEVTPEPVIEEVKPEPVPAKVETTFVENTNTELKYHVIAGCFGVKENADKFVNTWVNKGKSSTIVDKKGRLYRVAVQSFATRSEAKSLLSELKAEGTSGWVLKK